MIIASNRNNVAITLNGIAHDIIRMMLSDIVIIAATVMIALINVLRAINAFSDDIVIII